jgi:UDP-N-acetylglucosamine 2-epimerase (non-hydrolysing)
VYHKIVASGYGNRLSVFSDAMNRPISKLGTEQFCCDRALSSADSDLSENTMQVRPGGKSNARKILTLFGTRPEVIKLAPVIRALSASPDAFITINVSSSQHTDLLRPLIRDFAIRLDHDLNVMKPNQTLSSLAAAVLSALDPILVAEKPDLVLVQGDTTTALAGALAAFHRNIPVGHVEAGLRSGDPNSPFPEEMNRRLISKIATYHFAATANNRNTLLAEGVSPEGIFVTGNPVVDALNEMLERAVPSAATAKLLDDTKSFKRILLTTHRRESFGDRMADNLKILKTFVESHPQIALIFPVHPNPSVTGPARAILGNCDRIHRIPPMDYQQFVVIMSQSWLIVSDSGGVQEEAPSLGKPLFVLRENTERPEAIEAGCAQLVGEAQSLADLLNEAIEPGSWIETVSAVANPFGDGHAARRIATSIAESLGVNIAEPVLS